MSEKVFTYCDRCGAELGRKDRSALTFQASIGGMLAQSVCYGYLCLVCGGHLLDWLAKEDARQGSDNSALSAPDFLPNAHERRDL